MSSGFRFVDDVDAQRQLGVDRLTFEQLVRDGRLKPVSRAGGQMFFRAGDLAKLRDSLHPDAETEEHASEDAAAESIPAAKPAKKRQDPAMRVHIRLTADLKWYDISDADLQAWFDQTIPEAYDRYRANAQFVIARMQHLLRLIDEGESRLRP